MKYIYLFTNESYNNPGVRLEHLKKVLLDTSHPDFPFELVSKILTQNISQCYLSSLKKKNEKHKSKIKTSIHNDPYKDVLDEQITINELIDHLTKNNIFIKRIVQTNDDVYMVNLEFNDEISKKY